MALALEREDPPLPSRSALLLPMVLPVPAMALKAVDSLLAVLDAGRPRSGSTLAILLGQSQASPHTPQASPHASLHASLRASPHTRARRSRHGWAARPIA